MYFLFVFSLLFGGFLESYSGVQVSQYSFYAAQKTTVNSIKWTCCITLLGECLLKRRSSIFYLFYSKYLVLKGRIWVHWFYLHMNKMFMLLHLVFQSFFVYIYKYFPDLITCNEVTLLCINKEQGYTLPPKKIRFS